MNLDAFLAPFNWQFALAAVLINGILLKVARVANLASPAMAAKVWFKIMLTLSNVGFGVLIATIPGFLYGERLIERVFVGMCAGVLSNFVYSLFIKRVTKKAEVVLED